MSRIRIFACVLFLIGLGIGVLVSASYFVVNVSEIPHKISTDQEKGAEKATSLQESLEIMKNDLKKGEYKLFLKRISFDLSAVTPLVLFLFFGAVSRNTLILVKNRKKPEFLERVKFDVNFPLPRSFERTWIQLGFIGTLWGFMIIGLRMNKTTLGAGEEALDILVKAFGTALLSTFSAVVMVYIVAPIFKGFFRWAIGIPVNEMNVGDQVAAKLYALNSGLQSTTGQISKLSQKIEALNKEILSLSSKQVSEIIRNFSSEMAGQHNELKILRSKLEEGVQDQKKLAKLLEEMSESYKKVGIRTEEQHEGLIKAAERIGQNIERGLDEATKKLVEGQRLNMNALLSQVSSVSEATKNILIDFVEKKTNELQVKIHTFHGKIDHIDDAINQLQVERVQFTEDRHLHPAKEKTRKSRFFGLIKWRNR